MAQIELNLSSTRTFKDVPHDILTLLVDAAERRTIAAGANLFSPGDEYKKEIYILLSGTIIMHRPSGRQDMVLQGDLIGLANYLDKEPYTTKTIATIESNYLAINELRFQELEEQNPELFNVLNRVIATKLRARAPDRSISTGLLSQPDPG